MMKALLKTVKRKKKEHYQRLQTVNRKKNRFDTFTYLAKYIYNYDQVVHAKNKCFIVLLLICCTCIVWLAEGPKPLSALQV